MPLSLEKLRSELRSERRRAHPVPFSKVRSKIVHKHGVVRDGRLQFCSTGRDSYDPGSKGKVMYRTQEDAEAARAEMEQIPNAWPMRSYQCAGAVVEHWHLASIKVHSR